MNSNHSADGFNYLLNGGIVSSVKDEPFDAGITNKGYINMNPVDLIIKYSDIDVSRLDQDELQKTRAFCDELVRDVTRDLVRKIVEDIVGPLTEPGTFTQEDFDKLKRMINPYPTRIKYTSTDLRQSVCFPFRLDKIKPIFNMDQA